MKFYSEKTKELYDSVEALEAAEKELVDVEKIFALMEELAEKQVEVSEIATEIAMISGKPFSIPVITVLPDGTVRVKSETGMEGEIKPDGTITSNILFNKEVNSAPKATVMKNPTIELKGTGKFNPAVLDEIFGISGDKDVSKGPATVKVAGPQHITKNEADVLADILKSLSL